MASSALQPEETVPAPVGEEEEEEYESDEYDVQDDDEGDGEYNDADADGADEDEEDEEDEEDDKLGPGGVCMVFFSGRLVCFAQIGAAGCILRFVICYVTDAFLAFLFLFF